MKKVDPLVEAGLKAREMRKSLGYSYLAADEIIRSMRALREALPKPGHGEKLLHRVGGKETLPELKSEEPPDS